MSALPPAYRLGQVYDLPAALAECLVAEGVALIEMRGAKSQTFEGRERRKFADVIFEYREDKKLRRH